MGRMPEWYPYVRAARVLGCHPWELFDQSPAWVQWALGSEDVEKRAERIMREHQQRSSEARQGWEQQ